jgi:hypothetical protein
MMIEPKMPKPSFSMSVLASHFLAPLTPIFSTCASLRINPNGGIPYQDGDKLYIKVPDEISDLHEFDITVFRGNDALESKVTPTERYRNDHLQDKWTSTVPFFFP